MMSRKLLRWCACGLLGTAMIAQGYCLPANYWANTGRNAAVGLADALLLQYVFLPIAEGLGIDTVDPIINPNPNDVGVIVDPNATGGDDAGATTTP